MLFRPKKSSLVSGNRPGENFSYHLPARISRMCMRIYIFCLKKNTYTNKKSHQQIYLCECTFLIKDRGLSFSTRKSALRVLFKCKLCLENSIKLIKKFFMRLPVSRFFSSPAFPETRVLFFWPYFKFL